MDSAMNRKEKLDEKIKLVYERIVHDTIKKNEPGVIAYISDNKLVIESYPKSFFEN